MPRAKGSADLPEDRRKRARALLACGYSLREAGCRVGCAAVSVMRWRDGRRRGGAQARKVRFSPGRLRRLHAARHKRLIRLLLQGATAHGWRTHLWTTARIAELIRREFSIEPHRDPIGRLLHRRGWSVQKAERRALEREEEAIARRKQKDWPRLKKRRAAGRPHSLCRRIGVHAHPQPGAHPGCRGADAHPSPSPGRRDKSRVISGISLRPRRYRLSLYDRLFFDNLGQEEVGRFVRELVRRLRGPPIVLRDNSSTHKGDPLEQMQRQHRRLRIEYFPSYAPEPNPDEGVWAQAKRELANSRPRDVGEPREDILRSIDGIRSSPEKLRGGILQSEPPPFGR